MMMDYPHDRARSIFFIAYMNKTYLQAYIILWTGSYLVACETNNDREWKEERGERERERSKTIGARERGRDAAAERRIKVSGNVIYGIDLNPAFKPQAIIQSRSPFPSFSTSAALAFLRLPRLRPLPLGRVLSLKGTFDTQYILRYIRATLVVLGSA